MYKSRTVTILKCRTCEGTIRKRGNDKHSGLCRSCSRIGKPFEIQYKHILNDWRKPIITLTYEQFLEFTKITQCHYCETTIPWQPLRSNGKNQQAYFLDKKDNNGPYSVDNCVVCCTRCNRMRSNKFTYEEFLLFKPTLIEIMTKRKAND